MTAQILKQKSKKLEQLLMDLAPDFGKLETKRDAVFEQARKEGFNDMEIGDMIRSSMQEHYSDRTIRRILPDSAKHPEKVRKKKDFADNLSANEREPIEVPADKVKVEPTITKRKIHANLAPLLESVQVDNSSESAPVADPDPQRSESQTNQPNKPIREQPQPKEAPGRHNIAPEEYNLAYLHEYDKDLLIRIIRWLDNSNFDLLYQVRKALDEVEEAKPFLELLSLIPVKEQVQVLYGIQDQLEEAREKIQSKSSKRGPKP
jgi:hypothetical protein